jgi:hypothetical protein
MLQAQQLDNKLSFFYPNKSIKSPTITINVEGLFLDKSVNVLEPPNTLIGNLKNIISLLKKHLGANAERNLQNILKKRSLNDQSRIKKLFSDDEILLRYSERFKALSEMKIISAFIYGEYTIVIIDHSFVESNYTFHYVLVREANAYKLTNDLSDDMALNEVINLLYRATDTNVSVK